MNGKLEPMTNHIRASTEIPDAVLEQAARRMQEFNQLAEMSTRKARQLDDLLIQQISNEIAATLNAEVPEPDLGEVERVVKAIFRKYFGRDVVVHVREVEPEEESRPNEFAVACVRAMQ